ncbi:A/G-specific adenine glycosylase [Beggiatoa leptomitoformis]|uniref:Adenine DNA glycosylase n=1 Tax=Beggiatoa leptomitoformis TaxID=288004 RepID=A0A2N9YAL3_9GAMM|nr:A/G-specific adenine glycosylase [Beggiatoa leptomitoformis]ALG67099.1 A/G-specific adenine glycosylase [Beggiatoa leptomitoformis]AUI67508.1 A/G-specific adenine glycosylase [Beggiatoa leptomitoformis]
MMSTDSFSVRLLAWFEKHGRKELAWQINPTPYRVWVSEIMLQQTQVATVIPYYERFMQRFPTVQELAITPLDEVLHYWTGLGYYARARHLHKTAQTVCNQYNGVFPTTLLEMEALAGIGRSTAAAILALSQGQRQTILDGNVKRVLCRYHALTKPPTDPQTLAQLWLFAEQHTPDTQLAAYTQAIMDLGATVCTRSKPQCTLCPLQADCLAYQQGNTAAYPVPKPSKILPVKTTFFIIVQQAMGQVLLQQRPAVGIWGGLWSFPECASFNDVVPWIETNLQLSDYHIENGLSLRHTFTHFHLDITPIYIQSKSTPLAIPLLHTCWYDPHHPPAIGLAAPVVKLLKQLAKLTVGEMLL